MCDVSLLFLAFPTCYASVVSDLEVLLFPFACRFASRGFASDGIPLPPSVLFANVFLPGDVGVDVEPPKTTILFVSPTHHSISRLGVSRLLDSRLLYQFYHNGNGR